jgi:peptide-methionine (R)-S-oxide reductase
MDLQALSYTRDALAFAPARKNKLQCREFGGWVDSRGLALQFRKMLKWTDVLKLAKNGNPAPDRKVVKTEAEWHQQLTEEQYRVTRQAGTERAFSSAMCSLFEPGLYSCLCCDTLLFDSNEKFESHTGWPSFTQPIEAKVIAYRFDGPAFLQRVETICTTCDAHLGHVFPDGPEPSGLRYCMNAVALKKAGKT